MTTDPNSLDDQERDRRVREWWAAFDEGEAAWLTLIADPNSGYPKGYVEDERKAIQEEGKGES